MAKQKKVSVQCEIELTDEEKIERAKDAARLTSDLDRLAKEFKNSRADWRRRIDEVKTKRDELNEAFMVGTEQRDIECDFEIDAKAKVIKFSHEGKVVKTRDLTTEELEKYGTTPLFESDENSVGDVMKEEKSSKKKKDVVTK